MNFARVSSRPGEKVALGKLYGRNLYRRLRQLGCSQGRMALFGSSLRLRNLARAGALRRTSHDSTIINATLQKQLLVTLQLLSFDSCVLSNRVLGFSRSYKSLQVCSKGDYLTRDFTKLFNR